MSSLELAYAPPLSARVAAGAALLDRKRPGWYNEIDLGPLDIANCVTCIVGQLMGGDARSLRFVGEVEKMFDTKYEDAWQYGVIINSGEVLRRGETFRRLTTAWVEEIVLRRTKAATLKPEHEAELVLA